MKYCGNCGNQLNDNEVKCPSCRKSVCLNCGNPIGSGVTKCPKCGQETAMGGLLSMIGCIMVAILAIIIGIVVFIIVC